jgi:hypothetical protein
MHDIVDRTAIGDQAYSVLQCRPVRPLSIADAGDNMGAQLIAALTRFRQYARTALQCSTR